MAKVYVPYQNYYDPLFFRTKYVATNKTKLLTVKAINPLPNEIDGFSKMTVSSPFKTFGIFKYVNGDKCAKAWLTLTA